MAGNPLLFFPVGHDLGLEPYTGAHRVRAGGRIRTLPDGDPLAVWGLAHAPQPWSPAHFAASVPRLTPRRAERAVVDLARLGLLLGIDPESTEAAAMARSYRWRSMLVGHGMRPEWSGRYGVGGADGPWTLIDNLAHDLWRWGPITPTLWDACEAIAPAYADPPGEEDPRVAGVDELLPHVLVRLHLLVCASAGFLDEA